MKIVQPSVEPMFITPDALQLIELAGRTAYKSEDRITATSAPAFVRSLIKRDHLSVIEIAYASFRVICDRGVTHELVRHRLASYTQESTRYCNYGGKDIQLIHPPGLDDHQRMRREAHFWDIQKLYDAEIAEGVPPQIARGVLPTCLKTEIVVTANFREWLHIFKLRTAPGAHPQIREVMESVRAYLVCAYPEIFLTTQVPA